MGKTKSEATLLKVTKKDPAFSMQVHKINNPDIVIIDDIEKMIKNPHIVVNGEKIKKIINKTTMHKVSLIPINHRHRLELEEIKKYIYDGFTKFGYKGFSIDIDNSYDPLSIYFCIRDKNSKIVAATRITIKLNGKKIACEYGIRNNGKCYTFKTSERIAEMNSFVFSSYRALPLLFATLGKFSYQNNITRGYCLMDVESQRFQEIYKFSGWKESEQYNDTVLFPTFGKITEEQFIPTQWRIMEIDKEKIYKYSLIFNNYGN